MGRTTWQSHHRHQALIIPLWFDKLTTSGVFYHGNREFLYVYPILFIPRGYPDILEISANHRNLSSKNVKLDKLYKSSYN